MKLTFATTDCWQDSHDFGCASLGLACGGNCATFELPFEGQVLTGSYETVLEALETVVASVQAAVVLFGNVGGENAFMQRLSRRLTCPIVGGGAAIDGATGRKGMITGEAQVALLLITDDKYCYEAQRLCIHDRIIGTCTLTLEDARTVSAIDGMAAADFLAQKRKEFGLADGDFEHLTFADKNGVNAHLSSKDGKIVSGRDLCESMTLRYVDHACVYDTIRAFYDDPDAIVFGCAGLSGILDRPLNTPSVGLFLFGEVCTVDGGAEFGNLMLSKLRITKK